MAAGGHRLAGLARRARPVLLVVLAATLVVLVVLGLRIQTAMRDLRAEPVDNLNWNLTQLELDLVRFTEEARVGQTDPAEPLVELRKRFDLFYSRAQNAISGKGYTVAGAEQLSQPLAARLSAYLAATVPLIDGEDAALRAALPALEAEARQLRIDLRRLSIGLIERFAALNDSRRAEFGALVTQMAVASGAAILALALLLGLVVWLNGEAARIGRRLAATVDSALDAIIVSDGTGRILQYNPSAQAIFGFSPAEALGRRLGDLIVPEHHRAAHQAGMARMARTGETRLVGAGRFQIEGLHRSGRVFPVEMSISAAPGAEGPIYIAYLRDISDRLAAEAALTAARDEAVAAGRAKTNFLAVMSHEMRTPLNGVLASLELAEPLVEAPQARHFLTLARSSAELLLRHANDVLDITGTEAGGLRLSDEVFDPAAVLTPLVQSLQPLARDKGLALGIEALGEVPRLRGDPFRLGQILQNFLSNALKFTRSGGISVEYELQEQQGERLWLELRVTDTGPGIAEADQARIFDDFVMLDPSIGRSAGGAGLGLAITRRLVQAMGGEIGVESTPGEGSCFWARLPFGAVQAVQAVPAAVAGARPSGGASLQVLVIEDNATNRLVLEELLRRQGHQVSLAANGAEGVAMAAAHRFDAILTDIAMPVMDGIAATRAIRSGGASSAARIVAVTAHSLPEDLARFRAAGMEEVLIKPVSAKGVAQVLAAGTERGVSHPPPPPWDISATMKGQDGAVLEAARLAELEQALGAEGLARALTRFAGEWDGIAARLQAIGPGAEGLQALCHEAAGLAAMLGATEMRQLFAAAEARCLAGEAEDVLSGLRPAAEAAGARLQAALVARTYSG